MSRSAGAEKQEGGFGGGSEDGGDGSPQSDQKEEAGQGRHRTNDSERMRRRVEEVHEAFAEKEGSVREPQNEKPSARPTVGKHGKEALQRVRPR